MILTKSINIAITPVMILLYFICVFQNVIYPHYLKETTRMLAKERR